MTISYRVMRLYGSFDNPWEVLMDYRYYQEAESRIVREISDPRNYNYEYKIEKIYG